MTREAALFRRELTREKLLHPDLHRRAHNAGAHCVRRDRLCGIYDLPAGTFSTEVPFWSLRDVVCDLVRYRTEDGSVTLAAALPCQETYKKLAPRIAWREAAITVYVLLG